MIKMNDQAPDPASPALYPLRLQDGRVRLLELDEQDYRRASFLDERLLDGRAEPRWRDWRPFADAAAAERRSAHFIFHIGHVGSTLLSRLLGEHPTLFSVREPALLRETITGPLAGERDRLTALFARVWRPDQTALVKATSFVSAIAPELMGGAGGRAILLSSTPPTYLRAILGGPASRQEAAAIAPLRRARLAKRLGSGISVDGEGETIAMSWLCEALSLSDLARSEQDRCLWLDFDRLLAEPAAALRLCFAHFEVDPHAVDVDVDALVQGPLMRHYSKAPEHAYDADLRRRVLEQAGREAAVEIRRGMDWLQRQHDAHPAVGPALQRAAAASRASLAAAAVAL